ncbi:MAG: hypothetical protein QMD22_00335 [archaeon]|nr:hypothetical protein [archaeon]
MTREKISAKGIRVKVLKNLILLHNTLYQRYEDHDWKRAPIYVYPDFKNYVWSVVKEKDVMEILECSRRTAHDYLVVLKSFVG